MQKIQEKLRGKQSSLYVEIETEVRAKVSREQAQKDSALFKSHKDMVSNFDAQYESKFRSMQGTFDEKFANMVGDFEALMGQSRSRRDEQWSDELSRISAKWTDQWAEREKQWLEDEQKRFHSTVMRILFLWLEFDQISYIKPIF